MRRAAFMNQINDIALDPHMLVFLDESAWNAHTSYRQKGWSQAETHCVEQQCFVQGIRYSLLPALTSDGIIAYNVYEGSVTAEWFLGFLHEYVVSLIC